MKQDLPTLSELTRPYLAQDSAVHGLILRLGQCRLRLLSNSPALAHGLRGYFADFLASPAQADEPVDLTITALEAPAPQLGLPLAEKAPEPGKSKIKEEYVDLAGGRVVRKRLTGMVFMFGGGLNLAVGPCLANDNQVVNFINSRYIQFMLERDHLLCHAAAVTGPGGGLALAGFSGAGKSTLALHLVGLGLDFVSNDRLLIHLGPEGLHMHGVAKLPRINPGTALSTPRLGGILSPDETRRFAALPPAELWSLEHKYDVYLDRCFGPGRFSLSAPMLGLVVLTWRHGGGPFRLREVDPGRRVELLEAFIKSPGLFYLPPPEAPAATAYLRDLAGCPVYELAGGADFPAAAVSCLELLAQAGLAAGGRR
ncbi:MAG: HprK-related kinase B [Pseudomonadota bacterium]